MRNSGQKKQSTVGCSLVITVDRYALKGFFLKSDHGYQRKPKGVFYLFIFKIFENCVLYSFLQI